MSTILLVLLLALMLVASLRSIGKPSAVPHIDEVLHPANSRRGGWGVLPWLLALVVVIFALRFFFQ